MTIQVTGKYLHSSSSVDIDIDYTYFIANWLRQNPYFYDIFSIAGKGFKELQPAIEILAKLRDPAIPDQNMIYNNNAMLGFDVPPTSLSADEGFLVMSTIGNYYCTRDASYKFLDYLSFIKNTPLTPIPLWANSITMSVEDLVGYTPPTPYQTSSAILYDKGFIEYDSLNIFYGLSDTELNTGIVDGQFNSDGVAMDDYFPTTYFDVTYSSNDFNVDESVISTIIDKLKPAHLVFRQFDVTWDAEINYGIPNPISQIFSYVGSTVTLGGS